MRTIESRCPLRNAEIKLQLLYPEANVGNELNSGAHPEIFGKTMLHESEFV